jgi:hypothetical protein
VTVALLFSAPASLLVAQMALPFRAPRASLERKKAAALCHATSGAAH